MAYTYPIDPQALFEDRFHQFVSFGLPVADVVQVRSVITDMWRNSPGGWVYEWSVLARHYADRGEHFLASLAYGCAKFPCLTDPAKQEALAQQVKEYVSAAPTFPVQFERRILSLTYRGGTIDVPIHLLTTAHSYSESAVLIASGGVDTWKMDGHPLFVAFAQHTPITVLAFDQPGTGETPVPLNPESDEVIMELVRAARSLGNGSVAHFGMSFGGNFSAMTGLSETVDAAIVLGGPIDAAFSKEHFARLPYGMKDIVGNSCSFDHQPTIDELLMSTTALSRRMLLQRTSNAPMLVINGADDYFVPQEDTLVFRDRANTEVHLIPDTGHCAVSKLSEIMPLMIKWLQAHMGTADR